VARALGTYSSYSNVSSLTKTTAAIPVLIETTDWGDKNNAALGIRYIYFSA